MGQVNSVVKYELRRWEADKGDTPLMVHESLKELDTVCLELNAHTKDTENMTYHVEIAGSPMFMPSEVE